MSRPFRALRTFRLASNPLLLTVLAIIVPLLFAPVARSQDAATPAASESALAALQVPPAPLPAGTPPAGAPLDVVATTTIIADLVRQVGGARVAVGSMLPPNADPHDFAPSPADLTKLEDAAAIVRHGLGLDAWADQLLDTADVSAPVFVATDGVETLPAEEDAFAEGDPHVWFDPTRVMTMVDTIAADLTSLDPDGAATYEARRDAYQTALRELDAAIATAIATIPEGRRKLVTSHDALSYFADRYELTVVGTVIPGLETTAEPSAQQIADLLSVIERDGVPAIFTENTTNPALADELASEAGVVVVDDLYTDSLGDAGSGTDTYLGLMRTDAILIVEALQ